MAMSSQDRFSSSVSPAGSHHIRATSIWLWIAALLSSTCSLVRAEEGERTQVLVGAHVSKRFEAAPFGLGLGLGPQLETVPEPKDSGVPVQPRSQPGDGVGLGPQPVQEAVGKDPWPVRPDGGDVAATFDVVLEGAKAGHAKSPISLGLGPQLSAVVRPRDDTKPKPGPAPLMPTGRKTSAHHFLGPQIGAPVSSSRTNSSGAVGSTAATTHTVPFGQWLPLPPAMERLAEEYLATANTHFFVICLIANIVVILLVTHFYRPFGSGFLPRRQKKASMLIAENYLPKRQTLP